MSRVKKSVSRKRSPHSSQHLKLLGILGILVLIIGVSFTWIWVYKPHEQLWEMVQHKTVCISKRLGFVITHIHISPLKYISRNEVLAQSRLQEDMPMLGIDVELIHQRLRQFPWIRSARIYRQWPDSLRIEITERTPIALWQAQNQLHLIDTDGKIIISTGLERFYHLPHVIGKNAPAHTAHFLHQLQKHPTLHPRITARIFVDERRWDLIFDKKIRVKLPKSQVEKALTHLERMYEKGHINRDNVVSIDLRIEDRTYLELTPLALARQLKAVRSHS